MLKITRLFGSEPKECRLFPNIDHKGNKSILYELLISLGLSFNGNQPPRSMTRHFDSFRIFLVIDNLNVPKKPCCWQALFIVRLKLRLVGRRTL